MESTGSKIKDLNDIYLSIDRIAYQIYESNFEEDTVFIVGIGKKGEVLSSLIGKSLNSISKIKVEFITLNIDKKNPLNNVNSDKPISILKHSSVVVVDDVLNTGSTLMYAVSYFLKVPVKSIKTAVMVNRNHKKFPVKVDFKGISLATTMNEHISVILDGPDPGIFLT
ncbi:MAG: phosphoribosyltransferase [Flavobacteriaceae bacterium TMED68]|nr:MAG: phosphoribosyltransferase [Flavobacteriaceae bacterium TMED68]|tara:strand:+ start:23407 stop:23910 length:504 start_codon:yes stop_codon:yes gene_type:complete